MEPIKSLEQKLGTKHEEDLDGKQISDQEQISPEPHAGDTEENEAAQESAVEHDASAEESDAGADFAEVTTRMEVISAQQTALAEAVGKIARWTGEREEEHFSETDLSGVESAFETLATGVEKLTSQNRAVLDQVLNFVQTNGAKMNAELSKYHKMFEDSAHDEIFKRIGEIYFQAIQLKERYAEEEFGKDVEWDIISPMQELMGDFGISLFQSTPGEKRSLKRTHAVVQVKTADPAINGYVAKSRMPGLMRDGVVLIREEVEVYIFDPNLSWQEMAFDSECGEQNGSDALQEDDGNTIPASKAEAGGDEGENEDKPAAEQADTETAETKNGTAEQEDSMR